MWRNFNGNTIQAGTWNTADVTSSKPGQAVVNVKDLKPGDEDHTASAKVDYKFTADKNAVDKSFAQVLIKGITAKDKQNTPIQDVAQSELAKHLHLKFIIDSYPGDPDSVVENKTLAEWYQESKKDNGQVLLLKDGKLSDNPEHRKNNKNALVSWWLDKDVEASAQLASIAFDMGAQVDVRP
ncbi:hypothetical protein ACFZB9_19315 [Kitasatospora sp. NPDC008050]|uniref:hypothetical protein n=1 Tax=Kitasatospora sp. NPDC008050 TaxID=3364021 RepID=UPI0036EE1330